MIGSVKSCCCLSVHTMVCEDLIKIYLLPYKYEQCEYTCELSGH